MPYNNNMINQLYRQKENIENMITQYAQNLQPPVQNIINTSSNNSNEIDVKFLNNNEDIANIIINRKTLFIDEKNNKISLKETNGTISKSYDIIVPKDEKDLKIEELENKLKELEERVNDQSTKSVITANDVKPTNSSTIGVIKSTAKTNF